MSWSIVLILGACVLTAHSAVHGIKDATLSRIARSPHYGSSYHHDDFDQPPPPGPPPPPIVYHTQNWSGVSKGIGGTPQGVFSGAAASAQSAVPTVSEAFSLAASGTGPVTTNDGSQLKEKPSLGASINSGSLGTRYGGTSNAYGSSSEGQFNIKSSGLYTNGEGTGCGSEESDSESDRFSDGASGFNRKLAGGASASYNSPLNQANFDRQSGQRSINSGFGREGIGRPEYGRQNGQYGSYEPFGKTGSRTKFGSDSLKGTKASAAAHSGADFDSESGQYNLQTSNKGELASFGQSGPDGKLTGAVGSANNFDQYNRQSGSGYRASGGESYGVNREYDSQGGYDGHHSNHHDDFQRHGKSHHGSHRFDENDDGKYYQGRGFSENGDARGSGFANSQSSTFGNNKRNYGSRTSGFGEGYSGNHGEIESVNQAGSQDFSSTQQVKQLDQGLSASQTRSQSVLGAQRNSASGTSGFGYNKDSGSSINNSKGALLDSNANDGITAELPLSAGASGSTQEDVKSALGGALNLASQGLQAAQNAPCATCNKGSYALSNAKSHSGSAIALSIGG